MKVFSGELTLSEPRSEITVSVTSGTTVREVHDMLCESWVPYVLVTEGEDKLLGIASAAQIQDLTERRNERERERWLSMPVESVMLTLFELCDDRDTFDRRSSFNLSARQTLECTPITDRDQIVGVIHADDLLVSFRAIEPILARATTDSVTGLPVRSVFERRLSEEWNRAMRSGESLGVILIDVDHFKEVNDRCGHAVGDAVLHMVASCLRRSLRSYDVVSRYGGDEFAAICFGCRPGELDIPVGRLMEEISRLSVPADGGNCRISLSIGAAAVHESPELMTPRGLVGAADRCLYQAKENGRDCAYRVDLNGDAEFEPVPVPRFDLQSAPVS